MKIGRIEIIPPLKYRKAGWKALMILFQWFIFPLIMLPYSIIKWIVEQAIRGSLYIGIHWKVLEKIEAGDKDGIKKLLTPDEQEIFMNKEEIKWLRSEK